MPQLDRSKIMRVEAAGEARCHLAQLDLLLFAPGEKAPHGMGIGATGVGEVGEKNSSAAKIAFLLARCRRAGKNACSSLLMRSR